MNLSLSDSVFLCVFLRVSIALSLSFSLFLCLFFCLFCLCLCRSLSVPLSICLSSTHCLSACPCLLVCLSVCLCLDSSSREVDLCIYVFGNALAFQRTILNTHFSIPFSFRIASQQRNGQKTIHNSDVSSFRSKTTNAPIDMPSFYVNTRTLRSEEQSVKLFKQVDAVQSDTTGSPNARNRKHYLLLLGVALFFYPASIIHRDRGSKSLYCIV